MSELHTSFNFKESNLGRTRWTDLAQQIESDFGLQSILVGVHPSYGEQMVDTDTWDYYYKSFTELWQSHRGPKILLPNNRAKDYYWASDPDYEITEFPSGISTVKFPLIKIAGATAKSGIFKANGCVDSVSRGFENGGYARKIKVIKQASLLV